MLIVILCTPAGCIVKRIVTWSYRHVVHNVKTDTTVGELLRTARVECEWVPERCILTLGVIITLRYDIRIILWSTDCCRLRALRRRRKRFMSAASEINRSSHECNFTSFGRIWISQEFSAVVLHPVSCAGFLYAIDMNSRSVEKNRTYAAAAAY